MASREVLLRLVVVVVVDDDDDDDDENVGDDAMKHWVKVGKEINNVNAMTNDRIVVAIILDDGMILGRWVRLAFMVFRFRSVFGVGVGVGSLVELE